MVLEVLEYGVNHTAIIKSADDYTGTDNIDRLKYLLTVGIDYEDIAYRGSKVLPNASKTAEFDGAGLIKNVRIVPGLPFTYEIGNHRFDSSCMFDKAIPICALVFSKVFICIDRGDYLGEIRIEYDAYTVRTKLRDYICDIPYYIRIDGEKFKVEFGILCMSKIIIGETYYYLCS